MMTSLVSLPTVLPELILAVGMLALVLLGALRGERSVWLVTEIAVALLGVALIVAARQSRLEGVDLLRRLHRRRLRRFMKALALIGSLVDAVLSRRFHAQARRSPASNSRSSSCWRRSA